MRRGTDPELPRLAAPGPVPARRSVLRSAGLALLVMLPVAGCEGLSTRVDMKRIERPAFATSVPDWRVEIDEGGPLTGRYKVIDDGSFAEISWSADSVSDVAELEVLASSLSTAFDIRLERLPTEQVPGQVRLHVRGSTGGGMWLLMSLVRCVDASVLLTLSTGGKVLRRIEPIQAAMLDDVSCSPEDLLAKATVWPRSDLPESFGAHGREEILLADAQGRWLRVMAWSPSLLDNMESSPDIAQRVLLGLGGNLNMRFQSNGRADRVRRPNGPALVWRVDLQPTGVMAVAAFRCPKLRSAYLVLASDLEGEARFRDLQALSLRFDCPDGKGQPLLQRPGICEVGAVELCEAVGGTPSTPAEDQAG